MKTGYRTMSIIDGSHDKDHNIGRKEEIRNEPY